MPLITATSSGRWCASLVRSLTIATATICSRASPSAGPTTRSARRRPSALIGTTLLVRVRSETLEVYHATAHLLSMPRLVGTGKHRIDYRHVIWSLVRKPGAFAHYRFRDDLFPSLTFRRAYDALCAQVPETADRQYVRVLHLAASTSESEVDAALGLLLEQHVVPTFDTVRDLTRPPSVQRLPELSQPVLDLSVYDQLLAREVAHG